MNYNAKNVQSFFNHHACEEARSVFSPSIRHIMNRKVIISYAPKKGNVLDAGCGPGNEAVILAKKGLRVTLVDLSNKLLKIAKAQVKKHSLLDQCKFYCTDIMNLPFEDGSFDFVYSVGDAVSCTQEKYFKAISELARVLKAGGVLVLGVDNLFGNAVKLVSGNKLKEAQKLLNNKMVYEISNCFKVRCFDQKEMECIFKKLDIDLIDVVPVSILSCGVRTSRMKRKDLDILLKLELVLQKSGLYSNCGDHIIFVGKKA